MEGPSETLFGKMLEKPIPFRYPFATHSIVRKGPSALSLMGKNEDGVKYCLELEMGYSMIS